MKIAVLLFAGARDRVGKASVEVVLPEGAKIADLLADPVLAPVKPLVGSMRYALNEEFMPLGSVVRDGDKVALIPPVSGG